MKYCSAAGDPSDNRDIIPGYITCICLPVSRLVLPYYHRRAVDAQNQELLPAVFKKIFINGKVEEGIGSFKVKTKHF